MLWDWAKSAQCGEGMKHCEVLITLSCYVSRQASGSGIFDIGLEQSILLFLFDNNAKAYVISILKNCCKRFFNVYMYYLLLLLSNFTCISSLLLAEK